MAYTLIDTSPIQIQKNAAGNSASGYYLKLYAAGTTTPISMYTTSVGGGALAKCQIDSEGFAINGSGDVFIPYVDQAYKMVVYTNSTDADANTFASAFYIVDSIPQVSGSPGYGDKPYDMTLAEFKASTILVSGDVVTISDRANAIFDIASGVSGANTYDVIANTAGTLKATLRIPYYFEPGNLGIDTTGATDQSAAYQHYVDLCVTNGRSLRGRKDEVINIGSNLFIHGDLSFEGEKGHTWLISTETGAGADSNKYIVVFGVASFGGAVSTWNGTFRGLRVETTSTADFERALFIISGGECLLDDVEWDFTATDFTDTAKGGPIESGTNGTWATGTATRTNCVIKDSRAYLNHGRLASEGIALSGWENAEIINCKCYGSGDDVFAIHTSERARILNCEGTSITGRILIDHCKDYVVDNNTIEKIEDPHTSTWYESNFIEALMSSSNVNMWANESGGFTNNTMVAPDGAIIAYWMRMQGTQLDLEISGNKFKNYSATANTISISLEATVPSSGAGASWVGPTGNPDSATAGIVRLRKVVVDNNNDIGTVASGTVQQVGTDANLIGPFVWERNSFDDYEIFSTGKNVFTKSNSAKTTTGYTNLIHNACLDADRYSFTFTGLLAPTYVSGAALTATPVLTVCRMPSAGRIVGAYTSTDQVGTGGQSVFVNLLKNGSAVGSYSFGVGSSTYNERSYRTQAGSPATLEVVEGDILTVELWNSAGQLVSLKGNVTVLVQPTN